jgi:phosphomannomutase
LRLRKVSTIKFGTPGLRVIIAIAEEFAYRNVAVVTQAIAILLKKSIKKLLSLWDTIRDYV